MTNRMRAKVVEMLLCAASNDQRFNWCALTGMFGAAAGVGASKAIVNAAWRALEVMRADSLYQDLYGVEKYRAELLETAYRVREESWP